jgi:hypothetical protein
VAVFIRFEYPFSPHRGKNIDSEGKSPCSANWILEFLKEKIQNYVYWNNLPGIQQKIPNR